MLPVASAPIRDGAVAVRDGVIVAVGPRLDLIRAHPDLGEVPTGEAVLGPGLVDAHTHLEWSLLGGLLPRAPFHRWLGAMIPLRQRMRPEDHDVAAAVGALRCLEAGTTTVADSGPTGAGVRALSALGLRGVAHLEVFGRLDGTEAAAKAFELAEQVAELRHEAAPRVTVGVSPHAPYTVSPGLWRAVRRHPGIAGAPAACHLAESPAEEELIRTGGGPLALLFASLGLTPGAWPGAAPDSAVGRVAAAGVLDPGTVAAHCVRLAPGDAALLADAGVSVALCPTSNANLACGLAPLHTMWAAGLRPGVGTDSPASAEGYDVRAEARALGLAHGLAGRPVQAAELVRMATLDGAKALGLAGVTGAIAPGLRGDLVAVTPPPEALPGDPAEAFLNPRARVSAVAVDGEALVWGGRAVRAPAATIRTLAAEARRGLC